MKTIHLFVRLVGRPRRLEVEVNFSQYLTLDWINVNKDSGLRRIGLMKISKIEFRTLNWITRRIRIITVLTAEAVRYPSGYFTVFQDCLSV